MLTLAGFVTAVHLIDALYQWTIDALKWTFLVLSGLGIIFVMGGLFTAHDNRKYGKPQYSWTKR